MSGAFSLVYIIPPGDGSVGSDGIVASSPGFIGSYGSAPVIVLFITILSAFDLFPVAS